MKLDLIGREVKLAQWGEAAEFGWFATVTYHIEGFLHPWEELGAGDRPTDAVDDADAKFRNRFGGSDVEVMYVASIDQAFPGPKQEQNEASIEERREPSQALDPRATPSTSSSDLGPLPEVEDDNNHKKPPALTSEMSGRSLLPSVDTFLPGTSRREKMRWLHAVAKEHGIAHDELRAMLNITSLSLASVDDLAYLGECIKGTHPPDPDEIMHVSGLVRGLYAVRSHEGFKSLRDQIEEEVYPHLSPMSRLELFRVLVEVNKRYNSDKAAAPSSDDAPVAIEEVKVDDQHLDSFYPVPFDR